jgi:o-succinylbenzoate synthase
VTLVRHDLRIGDRTVSLLEGPAGWGEYSPLQGYACDPDLAYRAAVEAACDGWPAPQRAEIPVNALVDTPADVTSALAGYSCVKVKVGRRDHRADLQLVEAVRDVVGAGVALRVDANGAWDPETALEMIGELSGFGVELVEQPVESIDELAAVRRRSPVPVAADECVRSIEDAQRLAALEAADAIVLKVQPLGGVRQALRVADAAGVPALVTSMRETSVGIAAGLALAAALPALPYACGLVARMPGGDVVRDPLIPVAGRLRVRAVVPDRELVERYEVCS